MKQDEIKQNKTKQNKQTGFCVPYTENSFAHTENKIK